jgi:hypothetical protein
VAQRQRRELGRRQVRARRVSNRRQTLAECSTRLSIRLGPVELDAGVGLDGQLRQVQQVAERVDVGER